MAAPHKGSPRYLLYPDVVKSSGGGGGVKDICHLGRMASWKERGNGTHTVDLNSRKFFPDLIACDSAESKPKPQSPVPMSSPFLRFSCVEISSPPTFSLKTHPPFKASGTYWTHTSLGLRPYRAVPSSPSSPAQWLEASLVVGRCILKPDGS